MNSHEIQTSREGREALQSRRRWLVRVLHGGGLLGSIVSFLCPGLRYLIPPAKANLGRTMVVAAHEGELKVNSDKIFGFLSRPAILILTPKAEYRAMSAVCTHLGCTVQYRSDQQLIWCACHNGWYDLTGRNIAGPPPRPLERYAVHESGGDIVVTRDGAPGALG
jgi:cytochrome b6-f complex iron-sulfur subunit